MDYIAWLTWNPDRILFTVPFIDRPIMIYGACFVVGFVLGYFILVWNFKQRLLASPTLLPRDIACWFTLVKLLQIASIKPSSPLSSIFPSLNKKNRDEFSHLQLKQDIHQEQKILLLKEINDLGLERKQLEFLLPKALTTAKESSYFLADKITWFIVLGTLVGARLGHVFFYDFPRYQNHLLDIFKVWEGGLASHGGVIGVLFAVSLFQKMVLKDYPEITFLKLLDSIAIPSGLVACFIRIGNFFNQEIVGPETTLPWAIIFGNPSDGAAWVPRHPTQLYEAIGYFAIFALMLSLWKGGGTCRSPGFYCGIFLILLFGFRFLVEFIKISQSLVIDESFLNMGQYLSIPFILFGLILLFWKSNNERLRSSF